MTQIKVFYVDCHLYTTNISVSLISDDDEVDSFCWLMLKKTFNSHVRRLARKNCRWIQQDSNSDCRRRRRCVPFSWPPRPDPGFCLCVSYIGAVLTFLPSMVWLTMLRQLRWTFKEKCNFRLNWRYLWQSFLCRFWDAYLPNNHYSKFRWIVIIL